MLHVLVGLHKYLLIDYWMDMWFFSALSTFLKPDVVREEAVMQYSSNRRIPLDMLLIITFNVPFLLLFSIMVIITKHFDGLAIPFGPLMWLRWFCIAVA